MTLLTLKNRKKTNNDFVFFCLRIFKYQIVAVNKLYRLFQSKLWKIISKLVCFYWNFYFSCAMKLKNLYLPLDACEGIPTFYRLGFSPSMLVKWQNAYNMLIISCDDASLVFCLNLFEIFSLNLFKNM